MPELHAVIPGKPIPQARPRVTRYGTYNPRRQSDYMEIVRSTLAVEMRRQSVQIAPAGIPVVMEVLAAIPWPASARVSDMETTVPMAQRPDADNYLKLAMDAASGIAYADDSQVWRVTAEKWRVPVARARLEITIKWIDPAQKQQSDEVKKIYPPYLSGQLSAKVKAQQVPPWH